MECLIREGEYERALDVMISEGDLYPELVRKMTYSRMCLNGMLGHTAEVLRLLEEALAAGYFTAIVLSPEMGGPDKPDMFEALRGLSEFERLKAAHQAGY